MMLYKCIPFSQKYWPYVAQDHCLRFSAIQELWGVNDATEFKHRWDSDSVAFQRYFVRHIRPRYEDLSLITRVLCVGRDPSQSCWMEYCPSGGVRYEFEFDKAQADSAEIRSYEVEYNDDKTYSLYAYLLRHTKDPFIRGLLEKRQALTRSDLFRLWRWIKKQEPFEIASRHVSWELPFKKVTRYSFEAEYRFAHVTEPRGRPIKTPLRNQMLSLDELGLTLVRIATSNPQLVREKLNDLKVPIEPLFFQDS